MSIAGPNYTQVPHALLDDVLPDIDTLAELKVAMVIVRATFGWQKQEEVMSLTRLEKLTGMRRESVVTGLRKAVARGYVKKVAVGRGFAYGLIVDGVVAVRGADQSQGSGDRTIDSPQTGLLDSPETGPQLKKDRKKPSGGKKRQEEIKFEEGSAEEEVFSRLTTLAGVKRCAVPSKASVKAVLDAYPTIDHASLLTDLEYWAEHGAGTRRQIKSLAGTYRTFAKRAFDDLSRSGVSVHLEDDGKPERDWNATVKG